MGVIEWIEAKKSGEELTPQSICDLVLGFTRGDIPDYQMSAWLMAVTIRGMSLDETIALTNAMVDSGERLDLSTIPGIKLDKHSSGGVGDKITLALVPLLAAAGVPIAKMSGHSLGYTGGTLDKLESIPGFRSELSEDEIIQQVKLLGACICAQSDRLAPADRAIYALRDVTGTVASAPLVASSIMSKKIACGADAIILDIKVGSGAFMKDVEAARELAELCIAIGEANGKRLTCFLTDMDQPLGRKIGNPDEVREICSLLQGEDCDGRLKDLLFSLCREAFDLAYVNADPGALIQSGEAWQCFQDLIAAQGGNLEQLPKPDSAPSRVVTAQQSGYITGLNALEIARIATTLGASRAKKGDSIDAVAGVSLIRVYGDQVEAGEPIAVAHSSDETILPIAAELLQKAYIISDTLPAGCPLIYERLFSR